MTSCTRISKEKVIKNFIRHYPSPSKTMRKCNVIVNESLVKKCKFFSWR